MDASSMQGSSTGPGNGPRPMNQPVPSKPKRPPRKQAPDPSRDAEVTRAGMIWVAVSAGLILLVLLIIFILQNQDRVTVHYLGAAGELSLGMALFIAAVAGGILVAIAGAARILQLRNQHRHRPGGSLPPSNRPKLPRGQ
ncbi:lipopolysaccharide assembly LapA domain-containing protein [Arthrobacter sp. SO3]|uniref:LapA family protein n=1 Tax=Arthrobacter sp. SO3 TaxID=1897057 RepID=UPI001CFFC58A|nr:lipopolysaccharide assembly protein LapA domain-containing protein [Arthrobacter sp. SO3]MCB5292532.1 putative membrane protein [Arthrobacter sp. SO3]